MSSIPSSTTFLPTGTDPRFRQLLVSLESALGTPFMPAADFDSFLARQTLPTSRGLMADLLQQLSSLQQMASMFQPSDRIPPPLLTAVQAFLERLTHHLRESIDGRSTVRRTAGSASRNPVATQLRPIAPARPLAPAYPSSQPAFRVYTPAPSAPLAPTAAPAPRGQLTPQVAPQARTQFLPPPAMPTTQSAPVSRELHDSPTTDDAETTATMRALREVLPYSAGPADRQLDMIVWPDRIDPNGPPMPYYIPGTHWPIAGRLHNSTPEQPMAEEEGEEADENQP